MLRPLLALFLFVRISHSAPVRTSLCCCGCTEEPCPVVGPSCGAPQLTCHANMGQDVVQCHELQRLWQMAEIDKENGTTVLTEEDRMSPAFTPFLTDNGAPFKIHESGSRGSQQFVEQIFHPGFPLGLDESVFHPPGFPEIPKIVRNPNASNIEIRFSPTKRDGAVDAKKFGTMNIDKLDTMMAELQTMIAMVKGLMAAEVTNAMTAQEKLSEPEKIKLGEKIKWEPVPPPTESLLPSDFSDEDERRAIDDVIRRMKGAFRKISKETTPVNEIDSSVATQLMEIPTPPAMTRVIRARRAAGDMRKKEAMGNCNDPKLKEIIMENIGADAKTSKRIIQKAAEKEYGGTFNVICSPCEFSFVISSQKYCEGFKDQVACFVFLQPPTSLKRS